MTEHVATRVVLLARAGDACDRLSAALVEAGAELVLVADPVSADLQDVIAAQPQAVLVALEPAVEEALARFDAVLSDPSISVIFDEAELAAQRVGWDAARWVRHLSAKLNHHDDVLPPGWEVESDWQPSPGTWPPARAADTHDIGVFTEQAQEHAVEVPRDDGLDTGIHVDDDRGNESDGALTMEPIDDEAAPGSTGTLELIDADALFATIEPDDGAGRDVALASDDGEANVDTSTSTLELVDADALFATIASQDDTAIDAPTPAIDLDALEQRVSGLSLADVDSYGHGPVRGAVLIEGGLGGPDAVRQLLAALPEGFPRPVLVRLQLDGGRYDRLVKQMERVAHLPVTLAAIGREAEAGTVYFVPTGMSLARERAQLVFVDDDGTSSIFTVLPANDSAVLLLSGSTAAAADAVMAHAGAGMLVAGQALENCYDAAASTALAARGMPLATPAELAEQLAQRWPS